MQLARIYGFWDPEDENPDSSSIRLEANGSVGIGPDGRWLICNNEAYSHSQPLLWDLQTEDPVESRRILRGSPWIGRTDNGYDRVGISADGRWLMTVNRDTQLWPLNVDLAIDLANRKAGRKLTPIERKQYELPLSEKSGNGVIG